MIDTNRLGAGMIEAAGGISQNPWRKISNRVAAESASVFVHYDYTERVRLA